MWGFHDGAKPDCDEFDFAIGMAVAVSPRVGLMKVGEQSARERDVEFVSLAAIANVHTALFADYAGPKLGAEIALGLPRESSEFRFELRQRQLFGGAPDNGAGVVFDAIGVENSER